MEQLKKGTYRLAPDQYQWDEPIIWDDQKQFVESGESIEDYSPYCLAVSDGEWVKVYRNTDGKLGAIFCAARILSYFDVVANCFGYQPPEQEDDRHVRPLSWEGR